MVVNHCEHSLKKLQRGQLTIIGCYYHKHVWRQVYIGQIYGTSLDSLLKIQCIRRYTYFWNKIISYLDATDEITKPVLIPEQNKKQKISSFLYLC